MQLSGAADNYAFTASGNGVSFTATATGNVDHISNVTALHFSDLTDFVASQTPALSGGVSSAQVATLYAAVLDRETRMWLA